jgi:hypothetical protein
MCRLERLSDAKVLGVAKLVVEDFPDDQLRAAIEQLDKHRHIVTDITRHHLAEALDEFSLNGKRDLMEMMLSTGRGSRTAEFGQSSLRRTCRSMSSASFKQVS